MTTKEKIREAVRRCRKRMNGYTQEQREDLSRHAMEIINRSKNQKREKGI